MSDPILTVSLFGPLRITGPDGPLTAPLWIKTQALLAYLAVEAGLPHRREMLAGLLWPECSEEAARASLRQALHQLKSALGPDTRALLITPQTVQCNLATGCVDVGEFLTLIEQCRTHPHSILDECPECIERLSQAGHLYRDDLLVGFSLKDSIAFEEWLVVKREQLRQMALNALDTLTRYFELKSDFVQMEQTARRQVEIDPFREAAHRQVMRALAWRKQRNEALLHFNSLRNLLKEELGVEADSSTIALSKKILSGQIKAKAESLPIASPLQPYWVSPNPDAIHRSVFVGRKPELSELEERFRKACSARGQVVFVTGEAGWGKSALLGEFVRRIQASDDDVVAASGNGMAYTGIGDPYLLFVEILKRLTGDFADQVTAGSMGQEQARRLWHQIPFLCQVIIDIGPDLVGTFLPGAELLRHAADYLKSEGETSPVWFSRLRDLVESKANLNYAADTIQQTNLFGQYIRVIKTLARRCPLVLILDDLQWADEGTISLLFQLSKQIGTSRILLIGAYRPTEVILSYVRENRLPNGQKATHNQLHPLEPVINELKSQWGEIEIPLDQAENRQFIREFLDTEPNRLGEIFQETFYQQTRACPLFTVELLRGMQERGDLMRDASGHWIESASLNWEMMPARVEAVIAERIRRLPGWLIEIMKIASVEGEIFTAEVVAYVQQSNTFQIIQALSDDLNRSHRLVQPHKTYKAGDQGISQYRFRHILFERYLYQSLDPAERVHLHERIAGGIEKIYGTDVQEVILRLAWHYQEAGAAEQAVRYLTKAGKRAAQLSAHIEAVAHFRQALRLVGTLPDSPARARLELPLQLSLPISIQSIWGYGNEEVVRAFTRAMELCHQIGDAPETFLIQWQLACFFATQTDLKTSKVMMEGLILQGERLGDPLLLGIGHWGLGWHQFFSGDMIPAREHLSKMVAVYDPKVHHALAHLYGQDPGVTSQSVLGIVMLLLGYPEQAWQILQAANALAVTLSDSYSQALAQSQLMIYLGITGNYLALNVAAETISQLSSENGYSYWSAVGTICKGWSEVGTGQPAAGIQDLQAGIQGYSATFVKIMSSHSSVVLAKAYGLVGRLEEGITLLKQVIAEVYASGENYYTPEAYRLLGDLQAQTGSQSAEAEESYWQGIRLARQQSARFWELRCMVSLCRFWIARGQVEKLSEGKRMLAEIYAWFTEGLNLPDLIDARHVLEELTA